MRDIKKIISMLSLEEKASLLSGSDFWHTKEIPRMEIPKIMLSDGPHGLRVQDDKPDHLGINESIPATCFPAACATGCSFDKELMREIGQAIGQEALYHGLSVVLGPGANIKRNPLCGRNFEYISEDPYLTGELAASFIQGLQSQGVGASLKHFAANNQETARLVNNSIIDERALREIYLAGFEQAVKSGAPWTVMCSYNRLNGVYASENKHLLTEILRNEWGFKGAVVTDWGAISDRTRALKAGVDLEMPFLGDYNDRQILRSIQEGRLDEAALDRAVENVLNLVFKQNGQSSPRKPDEESILRKHHTLSCKAAAQSAVLLKNENGTLPINTGQKIAVFGQLAAYPRYQGTGSSKINPYKLVPPLKALEQSGLDLTYADGYLLSGQENGEEEELIEQALAIAKDCVSVLIFAGLPDEWESEGYDRTHLNLPDNQNRLIEALAAAHENVAVILLCGAPVLLPWKEQVKSILLLYLGGQAVGTACMKILTGEETPGGKLAETWPLELTDTPNYTYYATDTMNTQYRESIFVGYRWYATANRPVAFPFGFGLSYTDFEWKNFKILRNTISKDGTLTVSGTIKNIGAFRGSEVIQLYISKPESAIIRASKELKAFEKVFLAPGESKEITLTLDNRSFSYYSPLEKNWCTEEGNYCIQLGNSSDNILHTFPVYIEGSKKEAGPWEIHKSIPAYSILPKNGAFLITEEEFQTLFPESLPIIDGKHREYTIDSLVADLNETALGKKYYRKLMGKLEITLGGKESSLYKLICTGIDQTPLRSLLFSGVLNYKELFHMIDQLSNTNEG